MDRIRNVTRPQEAIDTITDVATRIADETYEELLRELNQLSKQGITVTQQESDKRFSEIADKKLKQALESN